MLGKGVGHSGLLFVFVLELEDLRNQIYALGKKKYEYICDLILRFLLKIVMLI